MNTVPIATVAVRHGFHDGDWVESKDQDPDGGIRLLQLADIGDGHFRDRSDRWINEETFERLKCSPVLAGDILIARMPDPLGRACLLPDGLGSTVTVVDVAVLRCNPHLADNRFVAYAINAQSTRSRLESLQDGATRQRIPRKRLGRVHIPSPRLQEQHAIADYLDRETAQIDTLMEEQRRLIDLQRERRHSVVDVGVFGLQPGATERTLELIGRHRAVEPLLAGIPNHWRVLRFKSALNRCDERNFDLSQPMMSLKSSGAVVSRSSLGERQEPDASSLPKYLVAHIDDLIVNPMWLIGGAIGVTDVDGAVSPDYRVFRSAGQYYPRYLHHLLRSRQYIDQYLLYTRAQTTFDRRIQQPDLNNLPMPLPPMSEQIGIATRIDDQTAKIDKLIAETERFIELSRERRSALVTAAVTGQIDVRGEVA